MKSLLWIILLIICGTTYGYHQRRPPPKHEVCDKCEEEDFSGFGTPASKCGCCPWPCCCKCFEEPGEEPECDTFLDLMWVLDSSSSAGSPGDWFVAKQFIIEASDFLGIGTNQLVAVVTFSTNATLNWCFDGEETSSQDKLNDAIYYMDWLGGFTNTPEALEVATECMASDADREDIPNVCIVMTDGRATHQVAKLEGAAARFREECDETVVIGIAGLVELSELQLIAGDDGTVFMIDDFHLLLTILADVKKKVCVGKEKPSEEKCFCCCTPDQFFGGGGAYYYEQ